MLTFKHSGSLGDIIYSLPTIFSLRKENPGHDVILYLNPEKTNRNYLGAKNFDNFCLSFSSIEKLKPLLEVQEYIEEVKIYNKEEVSVDLDDFRMASLDFTRGHIPRWYFYLFKASFNLSNPWLNATPKTPRVLVNRTFRYRNLKINYKFLSQYDITFIGLKEEFEDFQKEVPNAKYRETKDFLDMAELIAGCKLFIGNQSFAYSLAEAIKVPRILEACPFAANVIPHGDYAWDFFHQNSFEYLVQECLK